MLDKSKFNVDGNQNLVAGRDIHLHAAPSEVAPLASMIRSIRGQASEDKDFKDMLEELAVYMSERPGTKIIGLEDKLRGSSFENDMDDALLLKEKFSKKLARGQLSISTQKIYCQILAKICTAFRHLIKPNIDAGLSAREIKSQVYKDIIDLIYSEISGENLDLDHEHIEGMVYYLTGNCHIDWKANVSSKPDLPSSV